MSLRSQSHVAVGLVYTRPGTLLADGVPLFRRDGNLRYSKKKTKKLLGPKSSPLAILSHGRGLRVFVKKLRARHDGEAGRRVPNVLQSMSPSTINSLSGGSLIFFFRALVFFCCVLLLRSEQRTSFILEQRDTAQRAGSL